MCSDPLQFLKTHFSITPDTDTGIITEAFDRFGAATGAGEVAEAVEAFIASRVVASFVLQAASAEKQDLFRAT